MCSASQTAAGSSSGAPLCPRHTLSGERSGDEIDLYFELSFVETPAADGELVDGAIK
jgi:hypothetical protein